MKFLLFAFAVVLVAATVSCSTQVPVNSTRSPSDNEQVIKCWLILQKDKVRRAMIKLRPELTPAIVKRVLFCFPIFSLKKKIYRVKSFSLQTDKGLRSGCDVTLERPLGDFGLDKYVPKDLICP